MPVRLKGLQTFSSRKKVENKTKLREKEQKIVSRCIRRELAWSAQTHNSAQKSRGEQYLELPRALCTHDAIPHKGQKSFATKYVEARYKDLMMCSYPAQWVPDIVILEGMFLINTSPLITHSSMKDYARFLIKRFTISHFIKGVIQVHILFDNPGCIPNTPKAVEQRRRDSAHALSPEHQHYEVFDSAAVPSNWRDCLHCRSCKRRLVLYIGETFPKTAPDFLLGPQELVIGGCFEGAQQQDALVISQFSAYVHPMYTLTSNQMQRKLTQGCGFMHLTALGAKS